MLKEKLLIKIPARYQAAFPEHVERETDSSGQGPFGPHLRSQAGFGIWDLEITRSPVSWVLCSLIREALSVFPS